MRITSRRFGSIAALTGVALLLAAVLPDPQPPALSGQLGDTSHGVPAGTLSQLQPRRGGRMILIADTPAFASIAHALKACGDDTLATAE